MIETRMFCGTLAIDPDVVHQAWSPSRVMEWEIDALLSDLRDEMWRWADSVLPDNPTPHTE